MKINVEFDLTPDEFRRALGLPDVEAFQKNLLDNIQRQMESGVEGYDPMSLMSPFMQQPMMQQGLSQGLSNFGTYQQMMLDMLRQAGNASYSSSGNDSDSSAASNKGSSSGDSSSQQGSASKNKTGTASASSRAKRSKSD
ncbi:hypothetical protein HLB35_14405 [Halomonas sp. TBZ9]|uniref:Uncharacterized protein n=1 Tax=Vreelandella azerica TaxID=2732867 RepID=A0A7Y3TYZ3_9GAMM|nr:DUF6489 family protein [Halomonas azerica]NOG32649.1 hypothetical protein [Halomonas azerica]